MALKHIFICDNCKTEFELRGSYLLKEDGEQSIPVAIMLTVTFGSTEPSNRVNSGSTSQGAVWCRTCVMKHGLSKPYNPEDKIVAPVHTPTFEEIVTDLIERLGFERTP